MVPNLFDWPGGFPVLPLSQRGRVLYGQNDCGVAAGYNIVTLLSTSAWFRSSSSISAPPPVGGIHSYVTHRWGKKKMASSWFLSLSPHTPKSRCNDRILTQRDGLFSVQDFPRSYRAAQSAQRCKDMRMYFSRLKLLVNGEEIR